jgi:hypothetical protein
MRCTQRNDRHALLLASNPDPGTYASILQSHGEPLTSGQEVVCFVERVLTERGFKCLIADPSDGTVAVDTFIQSFRVRQQSPDAGKEVRVHDVGRNPKWVLIHVASAIPV